MPIYPDDRVLVAVMNNKKDWQRVQDEHWYRIPARHAPPQAPHLDWLAFYFTRVFGPDKWAVHYYAAVKGHELLSRRDLIPSQPDHRRANDWYYKFELGPLQHKIPPIESHNWRRITFIFTTGDRFEQAEEINDLFEDQSPAGRLYVTLKEDGFHPERDWPLREHGKLYLVDLALPVGPDQWLPIVFSGSRDLPSTALQFSPQADPAACLTTVRQKLAEARGS